MQLFVATGPGGTATASPLPCGQIAFLEDAPYVRNLDCRYYDGCLDQAERLEWPSFTCRGCSAYEPIDSEQRMQDAGGLIKLLRAARVLR